MIANLVRDIRYFQARVLQVGFRQFYPPAVHVLREAVAGKLFKAPAEIVVADCYAGRRLHPW